MYSGDRSQTGGKGLCGWTFALRKCFWTWGWFGKTPVREYCLPRNPCQGKVQVLTISKSKTAQSHKWVWTYGTRVWVKGSLCSPAVYSPVSWLWLPVTGELSLGVRKMPCYSLVKVFSSRAEADRGWEKSEPPWRSIPEVQREHWYLHLHVRKWGKSQDINVIGRQ